MITIADLPHLNATLNAVSTLLLVTGYVMIRRGAKDRHRAIMLGAAGVSALFLVSYLFYHANAPIFEFRGAGAIRVFYYAVLISHVILAALCAPMVLVTLAFALRGRFDRHRPLARWTFPIWLYVSVTGIIVYLMLYHFHSGMP